MQPRRRYSLAQLLCALCGMWAAVAPVAPQIHQSIAKHRHVYCAEHSRIEDEATVGSHDRFTASSRNEEVTTVSGVVPPPEKVGNSGTECLFSNFLAHALTCASGRTLTGFLSAELPRAIPHGIVLGSAETYRIAPKTSPPARA